MRRNHISVFGYENGKKYPIYVPKDAFKKHLDLLMIKDEGKLHYVLIKGFNTFIHNQKLKRHKKYFCRFYLECFSTAEILERHANDCFAINLKEMVKMPKKDETWIKNSER